MSTHAARHAMNDPVVLERRDRLRETERLRREENREWEREGRRAHRTHLKKLKDSRSKDLALEMQVQSRRDEVKWQGSRNACGAVQHGIDEFETNLRRLGIGTEEGKGAAQQAFDEGEYINRIRQRKTEEVQGRKERTKRRQKMLLDQQRIYRSIYERQKQEQLLDKIMKQSVDERSIGEELRTQAQWRNVMVANRKFREAQYESRRAMDNEDYVKLTSHSREREQELFEISRKEELAKVNELVKQKDERKNAKRRAICQEVAQQVVDLSLKVIDYRERTSEFKSSVLGGKPLVPLHTWKGWLLQFVTGTGDVSPAEELPDTLDDLKPADSVKDTPRCSEPAGEQNDDAPPPASQCEDESGTPDAPEAQEDPERARQYDVLRMLNEDEITSYINHTKDWTTVSKPPCGSDFNPGLCTLVAKVQSVLHPAVPPIRRVDPSPFMLVVFTGKNLSGKSVAAKAASEELDFVYASVRDILATALTSAAENTESLFKGLSDELKEIVTERVELARRAKNDELDQGKEVSDDVLARLVANHFKWLRAHASVPEGGVLLSPRGMLLEGFPRTAVQLEVLEGLMTTYDPSVPSAPDSRLAPRAHAPVGADIGTDPLPTKPAAEPAAEEGEPADPPIPDLTTEEAELLRSVEDVEETAIDLILNFDVPDAEVMVRYAGERVDPTTGTVYHLTYNPPPDDVLGRLQSVERSTCDSELIHSKLTAFRHHKKRIDAWALARTGVPVPNIDATKTLPEVRTLALERVSDAMEARRAYCERATQRQQLLKDREELLQKHEEQAREAAEQAKSPEDSTNQAQAGQQQQPGVLDALAEPPHPELPLPLSVEVASTIAQQWDDVSRVFEAGLSEVFTELRRLKKTSVEHFVMVTTQFKVFLAKPSTRQQKVDAFQEDFNAFDAEMRRDKDGMSELHLRADTLQTQLWQESDAKKESSEAALSDSAKSPWHDLFRSSVQSQFVALVELEVSRFVFTRRLIQFYFSATYCVELKGEDAIPDLTAATEEGTGKGAKKGADKKAAGGKAAAGKGAAAPETDEKQDDFTRTYRRALDWLEEAESAENEAPQKEGKPDKKDPKAPPPQDDGKDQFVDALARKVWAAEVDLLRYRLEVVCAKYYSFIEEVHCRETDVLEKLRAILREVYRKEMASASALLSHIRCSIEEQVPLRYSCMLTESALVIDETSVLVSPTETTPLQAPASGDGGDFITPSVNREHVDGIISRFKGRAKGGLIAKDDFLRLFLQVAATSVGNDAVPECWLHFGRETFERAYSTFDWLDRGACDWRNFCVSLILWSSEAASTKLWVGPPTLTELCALRDAMGGEEHVTRTQFMGLPFWFEASASHARADQLKELLWNIFEGTPADGGDAVVDTKTLLLYLCTDRQILRGEQKAFAVMSDADGTVSADDVHRIFHYTPYAASDDDVDDAYSRDSIDALFSGLLKSQGQATVQDGRITFPQMCSWHVGRVMLSSAGAFLLRSVHFE